MTWGNEIKWNESGFRPLLCTFRLNWARRTSWGWWDEWDDTARQTHDSKFVHWRSDAEHATSRSRRLPTIGQLIFTSEWEEIYVSFKPPRPGNEPRKAAVLTRSRPTWGGGGCMWLPKQTRRRPHVGLSLVHRLRRWPRIVATSGPRLIGPCTCVSGHMHAQQTRNTNNTAHPKHLNSLEHSMLSHDNNHSARHLVRIHSSAEWPGGLVLCILRHEKGQKQTFVDLVQLFHQG